MRILGA
jgi:hypothetical protein